MNNLKQIVRECSKGHICIMDIDEELEQYCMCGENYNLKECKVCKTIKQSNPTPDGDEVCPNCGDREMMDYEMPKKIKKQ